MVGGWKRKTWLDTFVRSQNQTLRVEPRLNWLIKHFDDDDDDDDDEFFLWDG